MLSFLGLDCGGSSSRVLMVDESDNVLFRGQSGPANLASTGDDQLKRNLTLSLRDCPTPDFACGCFAGLMTELDRQRAVSIMSKILPKTHLRAEPDYAAALLACPPDADICVIAGTGSLVCSRSKGKLVKSGGRGYVMGDYGSAFRYGRAVLQHYLDSDEPNEWIRQAVEETLNATAEPDVIASLYRFGPPAPKLARLAPAFAKAVQQGEHFAEEFLDGESERLAAIIYRHIVKHHSKLESIHLCLAGGLWKSSHLFETTLAVKAKNLIGDMPLRISRIKRPPVLGSVILAKELLSA